MSAAMRWLEDFQECVEGDHGAEWQERADEFIDEHHSTPDGWRVWREIRQAQGVDR